MRLRVYTYRIEDTGLGAVVGGEKEIRSSYGGHHGCPSHKLVGSRVHFLTTDGERERERDFTREK